MTCISLTPWGKGCPRLGWVTVRPADTWPLTWDDSFASPSQRRSYSNLADLRKALLALDVI
jgi:hypothetical protein